MENALISKQTEKKIINDLKDIIEKGGKGEILLTDYVDNNIGACMDFAMLYEASDEVQYFIKQQKQQGIGIEIEEDAIRII